MMKDKLYKYNHKAFYYVSRKALFIAVLFSGLTVAVGVPTTLNMLTINPAKGLADVSQIKEEEDNIDNSETLEEYLTYEE